MGPTLIVSNWKFGGSGIRKIGKTSQTKFVCIAWIHIISLGQNLPNDITYSSGILKKG